MNKLFRHILPILTGIAMLAPAVHAQRQRNYIYLFDCTQSMQKLGIWEPAKTALRRTIDVQRPQPDAQFTVIPFQGSVHPAFTFNASDCSKELPRMLETFDSYIAALTNTNIVDALQAGFDRCAPEMDNRVYLLTDGTDNVKKTPAVVALINRWCAAHTNTRLFYVTLDNKAVDPAIRAAIDACDDAFMVNCHGGVIPQIADIAPSELYANTLELDTSHRIMFSEPGGYALSLRCSDPCFVPVLEGTGAAGQVLRVKIQPRDTSLSPDELNDILDDATDGDHNYRFSFDVVPADSRTLTIANPTVDVVVSNRRQRTLSIAPELGDETVIQPGATSYPAFLFSSAKGADTLTVDLAPAFNDAAVEAGSSASFSLQPAHGQPLDYDLLYNGQTIGSDEAFTVATGVPARLSVIFHPEAATGKRYFTLRCTGMHLLELLNGTPAGRSTELSLRTTYSRDWNPLATALFWAGIALLAALLLWFVALRRIFFPHFSISALEFAGPGSYYARKRVRNYRMVRLTSGPEKQSVLSRVFTGRILIVRDTVWQPALTIVPGNRKTARVVAQKGWDVVPSRTLKRHESYELYNSATGERSQLTVE